MRQYKVLETPITNKDIMKLKIGDIFYLNGIVITARDAVHKKFLIENIPLPMDLKNFVIFHAGPLVKRVNNKWVVVSIGPTSSRRMDIYEYEFIRKTGVKIIIGKGGMGKKTTEACKKFKTIYAIFPGGCAALGAEGIEEVIDVKWLDLGVPEALWVLKVRNFGPLIVAIDTNGKNITDEIIKKAYKLKESLIANIENELEDKFKRVM
jgi:tartrate/fumarate subfamily iron-sulfur-dependent hydro-lyase beta chain